MNGNSEIFSLLKRKIRKIMRNNRQGSSERDSQKDEPELRMRSFKKKIDPNDFEMLMKKTSNPIVYKYFEPEKYHVIYGDFLIFNDITLQTDEGLENGLISGFNFYKKIEQISFDKQLEVLQLYFSSNCLTHSPSVEVLNYRLESLGDTQAKELADTIFNYYSYMQKRVEYIVESNKDSLDLLTDIEKAEEKRRGPLIERYQLMIQQNPITHGVILCTKNNFQNLRDEFFEEHKQQTFFGLVTRFSIDNKGKPFNCEIVEIFLNDKMMRALQTDACELGQQYLRSGIKEFLNAENYYKFWTLLFHSRMGVDNLSKAPLIFTTFKGERRQACIEDAPRRFFYMDGFLYLYTVAIMKFQNDRCNELKNIEVFPEIISMSEDKYKSETQNFLDSFYSNGFKTTRRRKLFSSETN